MNPGLLEQPARLRSVFARIDSGDQGAEIAFTIASRTFREAGLSWADLLENYLEQRAKRRQPDRRRADRPDMPRAPGGFAAAGANARLHYSGAAIPAEVFGSLIDTDRRARRTPGLLVVRVETLDRSYGPLAIRNKADLKRFESSSRRIFFGKVRHSGDPQLPELHQLRA